MFSGPRKESTQSTVGEGHLGPRIWESFGKRPDWTQAQLLIKPAISGESLECLRTRKLLERFAIAALKPRDNDGG
jgi:hypothetical protein